MQHCLNFMHCCLTDVLTAYLPVFDTTIGKEHQGLSILTRNITVSCYMRPGEFLHQKLANIRSWVWQSTNLVLNASSFMFPVCQGEVSNMQHCLDSMHCCKIIILRVLTSFWSKNISKELPSGIKYIDDRYKYSLWYETRRKFLHQKSGNTRSWMRQSSNHVVYASSYLCFQYAKVKSVSMQYCVGLAGGGGMNKVSVVPSSRGLGGQIASVMLIFKVRWGKHRKEP